MHAVDVAANDPFKELTVWSPDTDVFLLLIYYQQSLCNRTLFHTGRGNDERDIDIREAYEVIGDQKAEGLLGYHAFTGSDFTAKFNGKSKLTTWKCFIESDEQILKAFSLLGETNETSIEEIQTDIELFVMNLYCPKRPATVTKLADLRWYLFSKHQWEADKLPPTPSALKFKLFRSHFVATIWKQSHKPQLEFLDIEEYGWEKSDNCLTPITTDLPPAPSAIVEISLCKCKMSCKTKRCSCKNLGLVCTEMCFCTECENNEPTEEAESESEYESDESDNSDQDSNI